MDWRKFWNEKAQSSSNLNEQVGRVLNNSNAGDVKIISNIVDHIDSYLNINKNDVILDVCCGNALITKMLASKCSKITGIDISEQLIKLAEKDCPPNLNLIKGDALNLSETVNGNFDKILLYFSFQYFDTFDKGKKVISEMNKLLKPGGTIFLGDVTDYSKRWKFYKTTSQKISHIIKRILNKNNMGKFWKKDELDRICNEFSLNGKYLNQPQHLPYAWYRFDYLINKLK